MRPRLLALLTLTAACELPSQEWSPLLPDGRLLVLPTESNPAARARALGEPSHYAQTLAQVTEQANQGVGDVLSLVEMLTGLPPSHIDTPASMAIWGPFVLDGTEARLVIQENTDESLRWGIQLRDPDEERDWTDALLGHVEPGATPETSTGHFTVDFAAAEALQLGEDLSGQVDVQYGLRRAGATTDITFEGLGETATVPVQGTIHFDHDRGQGGQMVTTLDDNVDGSESAATERVTLRARWADDGAGRSDARITGGDFGETEHAETECWSSLRTVVFYANTYEEVSDGEEGLCTFLDEAPP